MTTKLTLTLEEELIRKAKSYAKHTGRSFSELVENYLTHLTADEKTETVISPKLQQIIGVAKLPADFDEDAELRSYYENKHHPQNTD